MPAESFDHAARTLRELDRDRYLSTLVLPVDKRPGITALYAFNAEVAAIRERVSNPAPGEIRLQWWNDALEGRDHGSVRQNPVADALLQTLDTYRLPIGTLQRLLGARRFDLYDDPMPDLESFEGYAGETASTLLQLSAMILNEGAPVEPGDAAGHLGVAQAMAGHLRALGAVSAQGRIMLPLSVLSANGVAEAELFSGQDSEGVHAALSQVAELAEDHLAQARTSVAALPVHLRPAFALLPVIAAQLRLWREKSSGPYGMPPDLPDWRKIGRMAWWAFSGR